MKFFLFFLLVCIAAGVMTARMSTSRLPWILAVLSIFVMVGYFFLRMI